MFHPNNIENKSQFLDIEVVASRLPKRSRRAHTIKDLKQHRSVKEREEINKKSNTIIRVRKSTKYSPGPTPQNRQHQLV